MKEKLQRNAEQHNQLNNEKDELLRSIEDLNQRLKNNETEANLKKKEYMNELKHQVCEFFHFFVASRIVRGSSFFCSVQMEEKENRSANLKAEERLEFLKEQEKLKAEEERILEELRKLNSPTLARPNVGYLEIRCIEIGSYA